VEKENKNRKTKKNVGNTMKRIERKAGRHECQKPEMSLRLFRNTRFKKRENRDKTKLKKT
jgi:hypothetical protein